MEDSASGDLSFVTIALHRIRKGIGGGMKEVTVKKGKSALKVTLISRAAPNPAFHPKED